MVDKKKSDYHGLHPKWMQKSTVDLIWLHCVHADQIAFILAEISPTLGLLKPVTVHKQLWARA